MSSAQFAEVVLDVAIDKPLDYAVPADLAPFVRRGACVEVPLRSAMRKGYVIATKEVSPWPRAKLISRVLSSGELINDDLFELAVWMMRYYCAPMRQVIKAILPAPLRKSMNHKEQLSVKRNVTRDQLALQCVEFRQKAPAQAAILDVMLKVKGTILLSLLLEQTGGSRAPIDALVKKKLLALETVIIDRSPLAEAEYFPSSPKQLNVEQQEALDKISASLTSGRFEVDLLHGVTGSGKTEVYLQAIDLALKLGKGCIMLVPEISLTVQTIERFYARFADAIAILHHRLTPGERYDAWHKIRNGLARVVIGARSAVFSPVVNLGLIIVDEEHDAAYKQSEEAPCYNARDVAVMRCKIASATAVLGSATPSLESFYNCSRGKYNLISLSQRALKAEMPAVQIIDMRREYQKAQGFTIFSEALLDGIRKRLAVGEQIILFLNRRGYHTALQCQSCGQLLRCHQCAIALTFHKRSDSLLCHLCGHILSPPPRHCPQCPNSEPLKFRGVGTEQVEKALHAIFGDSLRTMRIDADTTRHKGSHQKLLRAFGTGKADLLIGTQMVAKGLDFPLVTLVGILNADASLQLPDFRAAEATFQIITQVAGRAGRAAAAGEVIIQTSIPNNSTIQLAAKQDYCAFYREEIALREFFAFPPISQMAKLVISNGDESMARNQATLLRKWLLGRLPPAFELLEVVPSGYSKVKSRFRYQFIAKGPAIYPLSKALGELQVEVKLLKDSKLSIDINPTSTFF